MDHSHYVCSNSMINSEPFMERSLNSLLATTKEEAKLGLKQVLQVAITSPKRHEKSFLDVHPVVVVDEEKNQKMFSSSLPCKYQIFTKVEKENNNSMTCIHTTTTTTTSTTTTTTTLDGNIPCQIILMDFDGCLETECGNKGLIGRLFSKLKEQMVVNCKKRNRSFEMRFDFIDSIGEHGVYGKSNNQLHLPHDVKISYHHHCILVSDYNNRRIQIFDLYNRQFKATIPTPSKHPMYLCIEENHDGHNNDALLFGSNGDSGVYKFHLRQLLCKAFLGQLDRTEMKKEYIWKTDFDTPQAIAVKYGTQYYRNEIFVCNGTNITILNSIFGYAIDSIHLENRVYGLSFTNENDLIVSEALLAHRIGIMRKDQDGRWQLMKTIGDTSGEELGTFNCPYSLEFDRISGNIIVCDAQNHRIQIFSQNGEFLKCLSGFMHDGDCQQFYHPSGMCLNEMTGELLVCDEGNHRVLIFK